MIPSVIQNAGRKNAELSAHTHRTDIQALRAVAVIGVIFYHAGVPGFTGGYIGVDVFFVVSGFLITRLLVRELGDTGSIRLGEFWARRAWRLLPNAVLVLLVTMGWAWWRMSPTDHATVGQDITSALLYFANYRFAGRAVDYFDHAQATSPVLHFWSLSVEEQFYIGLPLFFIGLARWRGRMDRRQSLIALVAVLTLSFALNLVWMHRSQPAAFFHTEARLWQLAAGSVLALWPNSATKGIPFHWLQPVGALAAIAGCIVMLSPQSTYPGWHSLIPVSATVLFIAARTDERGLIGKVLAAPPIQWLGAISYSLYLWHWPILQFLGQEVPQVVSLGIILLVSGLAFVLIEDPLRKFSGQGWPLARRLAVPMSVSVSAVAATVVVLQAPWLKTPLAAALVQRVAAAQTDGPRITADRCKIGWETPEASACRFGVSGSAKLAVLFGDSYADHLFDGLNEAALQAGWALEVWTRQACPPVVGAVADERRGVVDTACAEWREEAVRQIKKRRPDLVLVSSWIGASDRLLDPSTGAPFQRQVGKEQWRQGFVSVLRDIRSSGINIAVIANTPRGRFRELGACLSTTIGDQCGMPRAQAIPGDPIDKEAASLVPGVGIVDLADFFCGPNVCYSMKSDVIVYRDRAHHLTATFSKQLAPAFVPLLK